jgi:hypothetical protein
VGRVPEEANAVAMRADSCHGLNLKFDLTEKIVY